MRDESPEYGAGLGDLRDALYITFAPRILAYLVQMTRNKQDAEDLLLDVFIAAFEHSSLVGLPETRQLAWLRRVARNKLVDRYRHAARLTLTPLESASEMEDERLAPQQLVEQRQSYERLAQVIGQLPPLQQELLRLRYSQGLRLTEIAERLSQSAATARKLLSRTLRRLRQLYEQDERNDYEGGR
jgi:RNA polymerase sigma-70 factor (ECF subfamily)